MSFHSKMVKLRKFNGFTQETFAAEVGVSRQSVYKWETGQSYPEVEKLFKISRAFHVTVDDLLNDELDINRKGQAVPVEEVIREEEELRRQAEEKRRRRAENKALREAEALAAAEAPVDEAADEAEEPAVPAVEAAETEEPAVAEPEAPAEEVETPVAPAAEPEAPVAPVAEEEPAAKEDAKKKSFFGRLFGKK